MEGQAGNWGVAVRMRMPPAARGPRKPRSLRGEESRTFDDGLKKRSTKIGVVAAKCKGTDSVASRGKTYTASA